MSTRTITDENLSAAEPLTPLTASEPVRYVRCNLTNRLVHPDSEVVGCQEAQVRFHADIQRPALPGGRVDLIHAPIASVEVAGVGVRGEITTRQIPAKRAATVEAIQ